MRRGGSLAPQVHRTNIKGEAADLAQINEKFGRLLDASGRADGPEGVSK